MEHPGNADHPVAGILCIVTAQAGMIGFSLGAKEDIVPLAVLAALVMLAALAGFRALVSQSQRE